MTTYSPLESARFGLRVGRIALDGDTDAATVAGQLANTVDRERLDVLIVRAPAVDMELPARLAALDGLRAIPADTLIYWDWRHGDRALPPLDAHVSVLTDPEVLERLVRVIFPDYSNHYSANPLFSKEGALAGYCEWAVSLITSGGSTCLVTKSDERRPIGFGIIDWTPESPDIRLAGILPGSRGRGAYRELIAAAMVETVSRGRDSLMISTQAHNTRPMRTWTALGWQPRFALATTHLVREALLRPG